MSRKRSQTFARGQALRLFLSIAGINAVDKRVS